MAIGSSLIAGFSWIDARSRPQPLRRGPEPIRARVHVNRHHDRGRIAEKVGDRPRVVKRGPGETKNPRKTGGFSPISGNPSRLEPCHRGTPCRAFGVIPKPHPVSREDSAGFGERRFPEIP